MDRIPGLRLIIARGALRKALRRAGWWILAITVVGVTARTIRDPQWLPRSWCVVRTQIGTAGSRWRAAKELEKYDPGAAAEWYIERVRSGEWVCSAPRTPRCCMVDPGDPADDHAVLALARTKHPIAVREITRLVREYPPLPYEFGPSFEYAMIRLEAAAIPPLTELLRDPDPRVRWTAAWIVGVAAEHFCSLTPLVVACLEDDDEYVRVHASCALVSIASRHRVPSDALIAGLGDSSATVRTNCLSALGRTQLSTAENEAVTALLDDPVAFVRIAARMTLARAAR